MTLSPRMRRQEDFLQSITKANLPKNLRKSKLQEASKDEINALSEIALNTLKGNIPIDPPLMARLKAYKGTLRDTGKLTNSLKVRRNKFINQKGQGFWKGMHDLCQCVL